MNRVVGLAALAALVALVGCTAEDTTSPVVNIVFPADGASLGAGAITIKVLATDNEAVAKVEFFDGTTKIGEDGTGTADTFDVSWTATAGAHTLRALASDDAGNDAEDEIDVTVGGGGGPTVHDKDITGGDSIWYPAGNPHIVTRTTHIREDGKLTIMPGCLVKFDAGASFIVGSGGTAGELQAVGKADSLITFTSNASTPGAGDWEGFDFYDGTRTQSQLSYCVVDYGGFDAYGAINFDFNGSVGLDHCTIRNAPKYGIWTTGLGGYPRDFTGDTITACGDYPLYLHPGDLGELGAGNVLTGNTRDGILVQAGSVEETGTWPNQGVPYVLEGNLTIGSASGAYLTIADGSVVKLGPEKSITVGNTVSGGLKADSVTFTSAASSPQRGDWYGIWFYEDCNDAECALTGCRIEYGGGDDYGNIWIEDALPSISGCYIGHSAGWGIYLTGGEYPTPAALLAFNTFEDNALGDVYEP